MKLVKTERHIQKRAREGERKIRREDTGREKISSQKTRKRGSVTTTIHFGYRFDR